MTHRQIQACQKNINDLQPVMQWLGNCYKYQEKMGAVWPRKDSIRESIALKSVSYTTPIQDTAVQL